MESRTDEICATISRTVAKQRDDAIRKAISNHLGREDWTIEEIAHRMRRQTYEGSDLETIVMDGEPIYQFGPVELKTEQEGDSTMMKATFGQRILNKKG